RVLIRQRSRVQASQDDNMLAMAEDDVDLPKELLKMVDEDASGEEDKDSILGGIQNLQNQLEQLKEKASTTMTEMKTKAEEKCFSVM
ncbi:complexin-4-like, partial [Oncorhynchus tshawytscha]|uniref:complexin-4-like n=1 Tax=Oncorhynchus tshawytscha TaxID=74940 RepID=UPI000D09ACDD